LNTQDIQACAEALVSARRGGGFIEALPVEPSSIAEAHAVQDRTAALLGEPVGAYKVNVTTERGVVRGLIYERTVRSSPAVVSKKDAPHLGVEGEIAFRFTRDFPARAADYTYDEVAAGVAAAAALEIVSARYPSATGHPFLVSLADCLVNGGLVVGDAVADWPRLDFAQIGVTFELNGEVVHQGQGGHPAGDPLIFGVALVNEMREAGGVKAGQVVTTGSLTGVRFLKPGDSCAVRFAGLGEARVTFTD
jgi:2-keto-4-pentenoate hydratase